MVDGAVRILALDPEFSLAATCGPVAWARGRWPNVDWIDGALIWVGWGNERIVERIVRQRCHTAATLEISGSAAPRLDEAWTRAVLGLGTSPPRGTDGIVETMRQRFPGLRPWTNGSLFDGLVGSIVGQSISVAAAAVTERRLYALFAQPVTIAGRPFWPAPRAEQLARSDPALIRQSGVTWRRAEALVAAARAWCDGRMLSDAEARANPDAARAALRSLPLVGPWTAESALLWGLGEANAYPSGDAALLRAARLAYAQPDLDHSGLNALAATWVPHRGWVARWLWTALLGPASPPGSAAKGSAAL
jgi:3-methyladenine DNA glycosylase/8-oxoguanine DNA glycosylase